MKNDPIIPGKHKGASTDTVSDIKFSNEDEAREHFKIVKQRFLDVNSWHEVAGKSTAAFSLYDSSGTRTAARPAEGFYFRINVPAPSNEAGNGDDWVQIYKMEERDDSHSQLCCFVVRPASSPLNGSPEVAHFFDHEASSTFIVKREFDTVFAEVHGRNEVPNNDDPRLKDKIRNTLVAIGAMLGFSKFQWKSLTNGLISKEKEVE